MKSVEGKEGKVFRGDYTGFAVNLDGSTLRAPDPRRVESLWPAVAISPSGVVHMSTCAGAVGSDNVFHALWTDTHNKQTVTWFYGLQFTPTAINQEDVVTAGGSRP